MRFPYQHCLVGKQTYFCLSTYFSLWIVSYQCFSIPSYYCIGKKSFPTPIIFGVYGNSLYLPYKFCWEPKTSLKQIKLKKKNGTEFSSHFIKLCLVLNFSYNPSEKWFSVLFCPPLSYTLYIEFIIVSKGAALPGCLQNSVLFLSNLFHIYYCQLLFH